MSDTEAVHLSASARLVAGALAEADQITVVSLTAVAGVSKSTVAKTLALLERAGGAIRMISESDGVREADLWSPGPALSALLFTSASGHPGYGRAAAPADTAETVTRRDEAPADDHGAVGEVTEQFPVAGSVPDDENGDEDGDEEDGAVATASPGPGASIGQAEASAEAAVGQVAAVPNGPGAGQSGAEAGSAVVVGGRQVVEARPDQGPRRLAAGELAALVAAALAAHPDVEYTPTMLSHLLQGRSAGAIHNVLEKMITAGSAVRTSDRPKRYRHAAAVSLTS